MHSSINNIIKHNSKQIEGIGKINYGFQHFQNILNSPLIRLTYTTHQLAIALWLWLWLYDYLLALPVWANIFFGQGFKFNIFLT